MEAFDLDHYELTVVSHVMNHTMNVDAKENDVVVSLTMKQETATVVVAHIRAVDRCGKESNHVSSNSVPGPANPGGLNRTNVTSCKCTCVKEIVLSVIVPLIAAVPIIVVISIFVTSAYIRRRKTDENVNANLLQFMLYESNKQ